MPVSEAPLYDLLGVGFGPANIALGGALIEKWESPAVSPNVVPRQVLFLEKRDTFCWHPGMLLPNTQMQISFMKDLATLRNPGSPITFLNYLHHHGRLLQFINRGSNTPSRREYADYLGWAARYVQDRGVEVRFSKEVVALTDGRDGFAHVHFKDTISGEMFTVRAKNLVISPGGRASMPAPLVGLSQESNIIHSSAYAYSIDPILRRLLSAYTNPLRIAVLGAGQSASEVLIDLNERLRAVPRFNGRHQLDMIFRKGCIKPSDDTPFANEIFDPASTDMVFGLPSRQAREQVVKEYRSTNYSVANHRTIDTLYELIYAQTVEEDIDPSRQALPSAPFIRLLPYTYVVSATSSGTDEPTRVTLHDTLGRSAPRVERYDVVICGTGYDRTGWFDMLARDGLGERFGLERKACAHDVEIVPVLTGNRPPSPVSTATSRSSSLSGSALSDLGVSIDEPALDQKLYVSRSYRVLPVADLPGPRVYLQGCLERTHGLSDTLLSVMGPKSGEIVEDLMSAQTDAP